MSKLSFEINLEDDDVISRAPTKVKSSSKKHVTKKTNEKKEKLSTQFISHIVKLGFDEKDASRLFETKEDWLGMTHAGCVLCSEKGCKFSTPLSSDCMFEHCRSIHGWRDYPCTHDNCKFVAYSKWSFNVHLAKFHSPYKTHSENFFSCQRPNCKATFPTNSQLLRHERIHDNQVFRCVFCPYVSTRPAHLIDHQRMHFETRDFSCGICHKAFKTASMLNEHVRLQHETDEAQTKCPLCERIGHRRRIRSHLADKHKVKGMKWSRDQKQYVVPEQI